MNFRRLVVFGAALLFIPALSSAQDFGVMESAETINPGNIKIGAYPVIVLPDGGDNQTGVGLLAGFGVSNSVDIEGRVALYDSLTFVGGDLEVWLVKNAPLDLSARGGFHVGLSDGGRDTRGFDFSVIGSAPVASRLEVYGALDMAFNSVDDSDDSFRTVHLVPGIEYAISDELDFLTEFGVAVDDRSSNYFAIGLSYYFR